MSHSRSVPSLLVLSSLLLLVGCGIPEDEHNAVLTDLESTRVQLSESQRLAAERERQIAELEGTVSAANDRIAELEASIAELEGSLAETKGELKLYADVKGDLEKALKASKAELADLRTARARAEARAQQYRELTNKLASMVQSGKLSVKIRNGKMVIELPNNVLFDTGKAKLKDEGQQAIGEIALVLKDFKRQYLVAGHTDNVPVSAGRYDSNWELSTARAVEVVSYLEGAGVDPKKLAAAGYGEHDPVGDNETDQGRAINRRIEIILMPNLDELPAIPKDVISSAGS